MKDAREVSVKIGGEWYTATIGMVNDYGYTHPALTDLGVYGYDYMPDDDDFYNAVVAALIEEYLKALADDFYNALVAGLIEEYLKG